LTGDHYPAEEMERIGLIGRVVQKGQALAVAREIAERIAANGPLAVQAIKRSVQETEGLPEKEALDIEQKIGQPVFQSEDAREAEGVQGEADATIHRKVDDHDNNGESNEFRPE
jgi:enoyl-CoA hydratase